MIKDKFAAAVQVLILVSCFIYSCAGVPEIKQSAPEPGKVYIYRSPGSTFTKESFAVLVDETSVFKLKPGEFIGLSLSTGKHKLSVDTAIGIGSKDLVMEIKQNSVGFIRIESPVNIILKPVSQDEAYDQLLFMKPINAEAFKLAEKFR